MKAQINSDQAKLGDFGYYESAEGRNFLRFCYARYLECKKQKFGKVAHSHGKIGMIVADPSENLEAEHNRTAQALRRWLEDGKSEIWHSNIQATIRVCQRLEALIAEEEEVFEVMNDRMASIRRIRFLTGLSDFFFPKGPPYDYALRKQRLQQYSGVYTIWSYAENERWEPYFYQSDTHYRVEAHPEFPILSIQEFELSREYGKKLVKNRKVGFMLVDDETCIFRFLLDYRKPSVRWMETFTEEDLPDLSIFGATDKRVYAQAFGINEGAKMEASNGKKRFKAMMRSIDSDLLLCRSTNDVTELADKIFSTIQWDIMI